MISKQYSKHILFFSICSIFFRVTKNSERFTKEQQSEGQEDKLSGQVDSTGILFMHVKYGMENVVDFSLEFICKWKSGQ